ncbi:MAG: hypothetical protein J0H08_03640, partial [Rhizobiales bacterium]|nr:hypothetical protein [Hyphomicrobiales bacterium]
FADTAPQFSRDGTMLYWQTDRFSTRQLENQTATFDIVGTFLSREAAVAFAEQSPVSDGPADFAGAPDRTLRFTGTTQTLATADLSADGATLHVVAVVPGKGYVGYAIDSRSGAARLLFERAAAGGEQFAVSPDGTTLHVSGSGRLEAYDLATGAMHAIPFDTTGPRDARAEMAYLFDHQWRFVEAKFYDAGMHGVDWPRMRDLYARQLPHISHWEDFAELMAELQGELNASHMFSIFEPGEPHWDKVGSLGVYYDRSHVGPGVKIAGVLAGGPADVPGSLLVPGAVILTVDGVAIGPEADIASFLTHTAGKRLLLGVAAPGSEAVGEQRITPVSQDDEVALAYRRWVAQRRDIVERLSGGRLGYVHVAAMNDAEMHKVYAELMGRYGQAEGAVIDVRFNTGGLMHDQLVAFLTGERHSGCWSRPTALAQNAFSYSDGAIFPAYYKRQAIGPVVGDRVPGTGTAVYIAPQLEPRLTFGTAQIGMRAEEGRFYENTETVPDLLVPTDPNFIAEGRDPQLEAAVQALLAAIDAE